MMQEQVFMIQVGDLTILKLIGTLRIVLFLGKLKDFGKVA